MCMQQEWYRGTMYTPCCWFGGDSSGLTTLGTLGVTQVPLVFLIWARSSRCCSLHHGATLLLYTQTAVVGFFVPPMDCTTEIELAECVAVCVTCSWPSGQPLLQSEYLAHCSADV
jgi:hypothetical protein